MRFKLPLIFAMTLAGVAGAQQVPDGLPWPKGVYLRAGTDWVGLPVNPVMPFHEGTARWLLGFGQSPAVVEMPGPHAAIQIANTKPMFYLRGMPQSSGIYLVRTEQKDDYRKLRMPMSLDFREFAKFRSSDMVELDVRPLSADVVSATPRADLKMGEYAIISEFEPNMRQIRASFEFGVAQK